MIDLKALAATLRQHLVLAEEFHTLVERESQALHASDRPTPDDFVETKKNLLARLIKSLDELKQHRSRWHELSQEERARHPEIPPLLRQNQDQIMKVIMLDRENEQALLRRGLVPPRHLPSANRQRPHFVADLYRRQNNPN